MNHSKKKKKRQRVSGKENGGIQAAPCKFTDEKDQRNLRNLLMAFSSLSLEEVHTAYKAANGDPDVAAKILANLVESAAREDQSTTCSSSSRNDNVGSSSSSFASEVFGDANEFQQVGFNRKSKPKSKKVIAAAGTVSTVLGKDYVRSTPKKGPSKLKGFHEESLNRKEAEKFLCSMLGEECELSSAIVSDVLGQCGDDLEKALDVLLELSATSKEQVHGLYESAIREDAQYLPESNNSLTDRTLDSNFHSSEIKLKDNPWFTGNHCRDLSKVTGSSESHVSTEMRYLKSEIPQQLLESLFNMPTPKTAEHEPRTMNWRNVVKKMTSLSQEGEQRKPLQGKGDEYLALRATAKQHWESMKSYYQKATTAFANGEKENATYLSEQGRSHNKMARKADEKASQDIFTARNKSIENEITIDLHGQHVKQAMRLLKLHLLFGAYVRSVRSFKVITGSGSHGLGKSKVKTSVINLLKKEGIEWSEVNRGMLFVRLDGQRDFGFLDSDSDI
ncbi:LOW QUALITY PROTEIN: SMR domain-containing protein At5g58720 [Primulina eburnea]|uniref:LOW QUALITY PROTEIN: SMR domain-containing protein At5g58720 n=1 Tax=Primulina eburnea TaxID=1245227 RepID=UPI003C6C0FBC